MDSFPILDNYCNYMLAVLGRSELTVKEYRYDLIAFFRFYKIDHKLVPADTEFDTIDISDIDEKLLNKITTDDLLVFLIWLSRERKLSNASRARRIATLKSFFKYVHSKKHIIDTNPAYDLETPKIGKRNPKYLTLEQSTELLEQANFGIAFPMGNAGHGQIHAHFGALALEVGAQIGNDVLGNTFGDADHMFRRPSLFLDHQLELGSGRLALRTLGGSFFALVHITADHANELSHYDILLFQKVIGFLI